MYWKFGIISSNIKKIYKNFITKKYWHKVNVPTAGHVPIPGQAMEIWFCMDIPLLVQILKCPIIGTFTLYSRYEAFFGSP